MSVAPDWLVVEPGAAPLIVSIPHAGVELDGREARFVDAWLARRDADWHIPQLYDFARSLGATIVFAAVMTLILGFIVERTVGFRLKEVDEKSGMDHALHGEHGYGLTNLN